MTIKFPCLSVSGYSHATPRNTDLSVDTTTAQAMKDPTSPGEYLADIQLAVLRHFLLRGDFTVEIGRQVE